MNPKSKKWPGPLTHLPFIITLVISMVSNTLTFSQSGNGAIKNKSISQKKADASNSEMVYFIFMDGEYVQGKLDREIEPVGGFSNAFRQANFKYPARARENGVQGTVWITTVVDEFGRVVEYSLKKGIGSGCDEESLRVLSYAREIGFDPPMQNGIPVKVKFDIPFRFSLQ
jgi:TonB family protein